MNLVGGSRAQACLGTLGSTGYIEAWQHIWTIFRQVGASNVAFVWCPSIVSPDFAVPYYPGDQYVDWIGVDGYDRQQDPAAVIAELLPFYQHWMADGKPMMIGETGATTDQASYLADLASTLPVTFPGIKALLYYDSRSSSDWTLVDRPGDLGLDQFIATGQLAYFSFPFISS
jgi:beta-mannanase